MRFGTQHESLTALSAAWQERCSVVRWDFRTELPARRTRTFSSSVDVVISQMTNKSHLKVSLSGKTY